MSDNGDKLPPLPAHMEKLSAEEEEALRAAPDDNSKPEGPAQLSWLFGHPDGRALLNPWIRQVFCYCPEIRSWVQVKWVDPRNAYDFYLTSPKKPPFNKTRMSIETIYDSKQMPLEFPKDNLIFTGDYTGSWPAERLYCDAFTVLESNGKGKASRHERSWKANSKPTSDQPGPSYAAVKQKPSQPAEKRPRVHCSCGKPMRCEECD